MLTVVSPSQDTRTLWHKGKATSNQSLHSKFGGFPEYGQMGMRRIFQCSHYQEQTLTRSSLNASDETHAAAHSCLTAWQTEQPNVLTIRCHGEPIVQAAYSHEGSHRDTQLHGCVLNE